MKEKSIQILKDKIINLRKILSDNSFTLPLFVWFRMNEQNLVMPVNHIEYNNTGVNVINGKVEPMFLNWDELKGIESLHDSNRKAFFINDYDDVDDIEDQEQVAYNVMLKLYNKNLI